MKDTINSMRCHDCGALVGEKHHEGCDVEECPTCHGQIISCGCDNKDLGLSLRLPYGKETRAKFYDGKYKNIQDFILSQHQSDMEKFKEALGEETTDKYWMKRLKVPSSDYSCGHMHGWNMLRQKVLKRLERYENKGNKTES
jgi:hypothetical protein